MASGLVYLYNVTSTGQPNEFNLQFSVTPGQQFFQYDKFISPTQQILEIVTAPTGTLSSGSLTVKLLNVNTNVPSVVNQGNYFAIEHTPNHKLGQAKTLVTLMNNIDRYIAYLNANKFLIDSVIPTNYEILQKLGYDEVSGNLLIDSNALAKQIDLHEHDNKTTIDKITEDGSNLPLWNGSEWPNNTNNMLKTIYDTNDDGIVNSAETLNGLLSTVNELNMLQGVTDNVQIQLNTKQDISEKGQPDGYASLDTNNRVPLTEVYPHTLVVGDLAARDALVSTIFDVESLRVYVEDTSEEFIRHNNAWVLLQSSTNSIDWINITNKPNSFVSDIDDAVAKKHDHTNKLVLDATEESFTTVLKDKYDSYETDKQSITEKGQPDGYASLDSNGKVPLSQLPDSTKGQTFVVLDETERLALDTLSLIAGDKVYETNTGDSYIWNGSSWLILAKADWENVSLDWSNITNKPTALVTDIDDAVTKSHEHINKLLLDTYTQTNVNLTDAVNKKHEHTNKDSLDLITKDVNDDPLWNGNPWPGGSGSGDMLKSVYDADNDGKVDMANVADKVDWSGVQNKPATYPPSAHTHGISDVLGLTTHINNLTDLIDNAMLKDDFDVNGNGIVDRAEVADAVDWNNITNKPTNLADGHNHSNKAALDLITKDASDNPLWNGAAWPGGSGSGDMLKSVYDTTNSGIVDSAETLDGLTASITELNYVEGVTSSIQIQLNDKQDTSEKGQAEGYASLDVNSRVPLTEVYPHTLVVSNIAGRDALVSTLFDIQGLRVYVEDTSEEYIRHNNAWLLLMSSSSSVEWDDINNKPVSIVSDIDDAVDKKHAHSNITILNNTTASFTSALKLVYDTYSTSKQNVSEKGNADGYASLDSNGKVPLTQLPDSSKGQTYVVLDTSERNAIVTAELLTGDICYETSTGDSYIWSGSAWVVLAKANWENINIAWANITNKPTSTVSDIDDAVTKSHEHSNKTLLDSYNQTNIDLTDAVSKKHEHSNGAILNNITEAFTTILKTQYDDYATNKQNVSEKGNADGYASLDSNGKVPLTQLPDTAKGQTYVVVDTTARGAIITSTLLSGDKCYETSTGDSYIWDGSNWQVLAQANWENVSLDWVNIINGPTSAVVDIDDAVSKKHAHSNEAVLDQLSQQHIDDSHIHANEETLDLIGKDGSNNPTWNGAAWPGVEDHTLLTNQNGDEEYLHITRAEKTKYDGYEALINDLLSRLAVVEQNIDIIYPVEFGLPSTHEQIDTTVLSTTYIDFPLTKSNDVAYIINQSNIVTLPNNIIHGSVTVVEIGEEKYLRVPVRPTLYNEVYTVTINSDAIAYNGIGNSQTISTTFTTVAANEVVITNSPFDGQVDVIKNNFVLTYDLSTNDPGSIIALHDAGAITVTGADVGAITISGGKLRIPLSNMAYEANVSVTIGAGAISNSGTLNTTVVTTTFTIEADSGSPYEWEYEYHLTTGQTSLLLNNPVSGTFTENITLEDFYGPDYDGANKTVEVLWFGYVGNIIHPDGSPVATSVETWTHETPDGKVDYDDMNTITFAGGSGSTRIYKVVKHKVPVTRS